MEFKVGDMVRRIHGGYAGMDVGDTDIVVEVRPAGGYVNVRLRKYADPVNNVLWHAGYNLELLYRKPKVIDNLACGKCESLF